MFNSGSKAAKPLTIAAALLFKDLTSNVSTTGKPSTLASLAVEPMSESAENPSYNPLTPSTMQRSASLEAYPTTFLMVSSSIMKESMFLDALPEANVWYIGSMKSGPALKAWTL